ncbi:MAG: coenzyme F420-0:L-glutamate ligase [Firmicutes bacterium]|nr:coenzyme F420-0:L-glutamate ligase [Bacillota bacterium]MDY5335272.1 coenzyme F420-0:L-glutamate ligase [Bacilli bacterium]
MRCVGTVVRGIRTGVIKRGDNLEKIVVDSVMNASSNDNFEIRDKDIIAVTEAVVGIATGNYVSVDDIASDIRNKFPNNEVGIVFPILSRNRFSMILKGIARGTKKIYMLLSYPADEVGNHLFDEKLLYKYNINPYIDCFDEKKYRELFGNIVHEFTGVNYVDVYTEICKNEGCDIEFIFSNNPRDILKYTKDILASDIHTRNNTKKLLEDADIILGLDDIMTKSINGSGYNSKYGLLGSNKSTDELLKLFPENGKELVLGIQKDIKNRTGKNVEVMIYGDGAFKDPIGKIWELADPVVSPFYTDGLEGTPNEIKLKYVSDNTLSDLHGEELNKAMKEEIKKKESNLVGQNKSLGTTPRRIVDLVGSLCDLTSGSGDKGTPVVLIQGYFDNYAND